MSTDIEEAARKLVEQLDNREEWSFMLSTPDDLIKLIRSVVRDELTRAGITPAEEEAPDPDIDRCTFEDESGDRCIMRYVHVHSNSNRPHRFAANAGVR